MIVYNYIIIWLILIFGFSENNRVESMIYKNQHVTFSGQYYMVQSFGFIEGGTIEFNATINSPDTTTINNFNNQSASMPYTYNKHNYLDFLTLYVCVDRDFQSLIGSSTNNEIETKLCNSPNEGTCPVRNVSVTSNFSYRYTFDDSDLYRIILLKCNTSASVDLTLNYVLLNNGHHLSLGYIQMPTVYMSMLIVIVLLFSCYIVYILRFKAHINELHIIICFILGFKLILLILSFVYWKSADVSGKYNSVTNNLENLFFSVEETIFFGGLLLMSKGWRITRATLPPSEVRTISIIMVLLLSVLMFFSFYNDVYYFLSLMILYFFMMPKLFTNITKNLRLLETHVTLAGYTNNARSVHIFQRKIRAFQYLRTSVVLYLGGILIVNSMRIIMVWFLYWVTFSVSEPMSLAMLAFLCFLFRPYLRNPLFLNSNLDTISIVELTRNLAELSQQNLDPLALSNYFDLKTYDPKNCIIIEYPGSSASSLGVLDTKD